MPVKYVFITGGVVSDLGKGIIAVSLGRLLKTRGYKVTVQRFDPYINIGPGAMDPVQHGEVFVTDDSTEANLDLGHYEHLIDESLTRNSDITTDKVYQTVLQKERRRDFGGGAIQVILHITNEIRNRFHRNYTENETEIAIAEVGGTVGGIEDQPFLEAIRQFRHSADPGSACIIHVTLIPYLKASKELETEPTQASVGNLQRMGIQPNVLVCCPELPLDNSIKVKIAQFCNVPKHHVFQNLGVDVLYEVSLVMEEKHLAQSICERLDPPYLEPDPTDWKAMIGTWKHPEQGMAVALIGKHVQLHGAYISVVGALRHGGVVNCAAVHMKWVDFETVTPENAPQISKDVNGIPIPGGSGDRGIGGKIHAIQHARERRIPFLKLCLGMQLSVMEFAGNVVGYAGAHSVELNPVTTYSVIHLMLEQNGVEGAGDTLGLGSYPCVLDETSRAYGLYSETTIYECHRHRYEVNNDYHTVLTKCDMMSSGLSPDGRIVEMIELLGHSWFIAIQTRPGLRSGPNRPHPLSKGFMEAALKQKECKQS